MRTTGITIVYFYGEKQMTLRADSVSRSMDNRSNQTAKRLGVSDGQELLGDEIAAISGGLFWGCVWVQPLLA